MAAHKSVAGSHGIICVILLILYATNCVFVDYLNYGTSIPYTVKKEFVGF